MGHRTGRGLGHHSGESRGAALGDDDPVGTGGVGGTDDRTQVVGIAELVAHHDQGLFPLLPGDGENVVHGDILPHRAQGDDALVGVGTAHAVQLAPVGVHHHDALFPGGGGDMPQGGVGFALGDENFVDGHAGA